MICIEWWSYEICQLLSGQFGTDQLAAQIVCMQFIVIIFMVPLGLGIAASIRVGNMLGAGRPQSAHAAAVITILSEWVFALAMWTVLFFGRHDLPHIFNSDPDVLDIAIPILFLGSFLQIADGTQGTCSGIVAGCGRQVAGALFNFIGYQVIGLPIGIVLAFYFDYKVFGLWCGLACGSCTAAVLMLTTVLRTNWEEQSKLAIERCELEEEEIEALNLNESSSVASLDASIVSSADEGTPLLDKNLKQRRSRLFLRRFLQTLLFALVLAAGILVRSEFELVQVLSSRTDAEARLGVAGYTCQRTMISASQCPQL
eukprot:m.527900 g.527900  ORF g.527900 m.527900 type:complete len:314 (-) comp57559_c0_seq55:2200-3141(-)